MKVGGPIKVTKQATERIKLLGMALALFLIVYGGLFAVHLFSSPQYTNKITYVVLSLWVLAVLSLHYLLPEQNRRDTILRLLNLHLLWAAFILFITGFTTTMALLWLSLGLVTYIQIGRRGFQVSLAGLLLVGLLVLAFFANTNGDVARVLVSLVLVGGAGIFIVYLFANQQHRTNTLTAKHSQTKLLHDRMMTLVNNLSDAIISTDPAGLVQVYNAATLNLLDTNQNLQATPIESILKLSDSEDKKVSMAHLLKKITAVTVRDDVFYHYNADDKIRLELTISPIHSTFQEFERGQKNEGYIIILRDITKAKNLEEERDEFISVVSHELRTPIAIAEGSISNIQLLLERHLADPDTLKKTVDTAHEQIVLLANMMNDLSALSRAERGVAAEKEHISLKELAESLYAAYHQSASAKQLRFDLDLSSRLGYIDVSRTYLEELIQNFITNAIKYTKTGSVTLRIQQHEASATIAVKDSGIGISRSDQQKVFDKFYRSEDYRTRETGGTGLGLYVAKKLADKLGTKIVLTSRLNHGSTFSFELPTTKN